ncbi:TGS domain-containing protein [Candidatus Pacearchaeota archaeon]|nr:TGS domain-containing protein [Candidatus Pacearchaeota archaeon]
MPINAGYEFADAEKKYFLAQNDEERVIALEEMLRKAPAHKGSEKFRGDIRLKIKKTKELIVKQKKSGKSSKKGIKKEDMQAVLLGLTNSGKSSILKILTNANPKIASYGFTTCEPEVGTLRYNNCNIQIIDLPPIASEEFEKGIVNGADTILIVVEKIHEIKEIEKTINNKLAKRIVIFNKIDSYDKETKRKISESLKSKRYNFVMFSSKTNEGINELNEKIYKSFNIIRVYTRQPGKKEDKYPVIIKPKSTLKDVAEKVLHGFSKKVKYAKVYGPSAKFLGQKIGLKHIVKDKDIVEFITE